MPRKIKDIGSHATSRIKRSIYSCLVLGLRDSIGAGVIASALIYASMRGPSFPRQMHPSSIPKVLIWIYWISPIHFTFLALAQNEFHGQVFTCASADKICLATGEQILGFYDLYYPSIWTCFLIIIGMTVAYNIAGYLALRHVTRRSSAQ